MDVVVGADLVSGVASELVLFLVLGTGSAGRADVGGPFDGREGLGSAVNIMVLWPLNCGENSGRK